MSAENCRNQPQKSSAGRKMMILRLSLAIIVAISFVLALTSCQKGLENKNENTGAAGQNGSTDSGITIVKSSITDDATFFPYQAGDTYMEIIAIRASDGTVRTAFNTCQVCNGSGRAYYEQSGDVLVCQNCGNRFTVDQVEVVKGGCNPIPIFESSKQDDGETITIPGSYLDAN